MTDKHQDKPVVLYRFTGPDKFPGIPARDLTQDDYDALNIDQKRDVIATSSYESLQGDEFPVNVPTVDFSKLNRTELEEYAADNGVVDPASYTNKDLLIEAIQAAKDGK